MKQRERGISRKNGSGTIPFTRGLSLAFQHVKGIAGLGNLAKRPDTVHKVSGATGIFYLSDKDVEILDGLAESGVEVVFHQLPTSAKTTWKDFKATL